MITDKPIHLDRELTRDFGPDSGALVTFTGAIRERNNGRRVKGIFYDCYREMAEREIGRIIQDVQKTHRLRNVRAVHRVGEVAVGEIWLLVAVTAEHRREAFEGCHAIVDEIKRRAPIWKKEHYADHTAQWI